MTRMIEKITETIELELKDHLVHKVQQVHKEFKAYKVQ
jgi:hypothetical protein